MGRIAQGGEAGFTLLEMVVVVAVIATLSISATFAVSTRDHAEADVTRFAAAYVRLRDRAILGQSAQGIVIVPEGWQTLAPAPPDAEVEGWQAVGIVQKFRGEVRFEGADGPIFPREVPRAPEPDLLFLPDGQVTPFEVTFIANEQLNRCRSTGFAGLDCEGI